MRKFVLNILAVLVIAVVILLTLTFKCVNFEDVDFSADPQQHILAAGQSTSECALDDKAYNEIINYSRGGYEIGLFNPILDKMLKQNRQVDTVLIYAGRQGIFYPISDLRHMSLAEIKDRIPALVSGLINNNLSPLTIQDLTHNPYFYAGMLSPEFSNIIQKRKTPKDCRFGFKEKTNTLNISDNATDVDGADIWGIKWYDNYSAKTDNSEQKSENIRRYIDNLSSAIEICRANGVEPVLFMTPLYEYDRWSRWSDYTDVLKELDGALLVADYEDFKLPDHTYYGDVHHLNVKGAEYFTESLKRDGIHYVRLSEWIKSKQK